MWGSRGRVMRAWRVPRDQFVLSKLTPGDLEASPRGPPLHSGPEGKEFERQTERSWHSEA